MRGIHSGSEIRHTWYTVQYTVASAPTVTSHGFSAEIEQFLLELVVLHSLKPCQMYRIRGL